MVQSSRTERVGEPTVTLAHCNQCGRSTNHDILAVEKKTEIFEDDSINWDNSYELLKCRGCESITMRHTCQWTDDRPNVFYYPPAISRRAPLWIDHDLFSLLYSTVVPAPICGLMREIYVAVLNNSRRLAAMGIRAALESVMIERVRDRGNFKENMKAFQEAGYLSVRQAMTLDSILDAGHAAIHRGWEPTSEDVAMLLDITESIVEIVYLHENYARTLDKNIPKRPPRGSHTS